MLLKRTTTEPNSPLRIMVDDAPGDGSTGMAQGGTFFFMPAGQPGDQADVNQRAADAILADPKLARHFTAAADGPRAVPEPADVPPTESALEPARRRRRRQMTTEQDDQASGA